MRTGHRQKPRVRDKSRGTAEKRGRRLEVHRGKLFLRTVLSPRGDPTEMLVGRADPRPRCPREAAAGPANPAVFFRFPGARATLRVREATIRHFARAPRLLLAREASRTFGAREASPATPGTSTWGQVGVGRRRSRAHRGLTSGVALKSGDERPSFALAVVRARGRRRQRHAQFHAARPRMGVRQRARGRERRGGGHAA